MKQRVTFSSLIKVIAYFIFTMGLASCRFMVVSESTAPSISSTPEVQVTILPPITIEPTIVCSSVPSINIVATSLSASEIHIKIAGLKPNEHVKLIFYSEEAGRTSKVESNPLENADNQGNFEYTEYGLDKTFKEWQIQVIHSGDVACTTISLP